MLSRLVGPGGQVHAVEASPRLESLNRRICRPLDRAQRDGNGEGPESDSHDALADRQSQRFFD